ncbi:MAG TPA: YcgN family cysteine cluster protein [Thiotrichales bacterium]|nr:YcgN family cysteine cluster protein [Thiotrichales bacterium]
MEPFWKNKPLDSLSREEWESLCDGCGRCCLIKLEDVDTGELCYTNIVCRHFDQATGRCTCYQERSRWVPECLVLTPELLRTLDWLPDTCAYRLLQEGHDLPDWHPLVSGRAESVREAGISVCDHAVSEDYVHEDDWDLYAQPTGKES